MRFGLIDDNGLKAKDKLTKANSPPRLFGKPWLAKDIYCLLKGYLAQY